MRAPAGPLPRAGLTAGLLVGLLAGGAATGLATTALHEKWWGLLLGAAATVLALAALPPGWGTRLPFALGWTGIVGTASTPRPEGDYAVAQDPAGYLLLVLGLVVLLVAVVTLPFAGSRRGGA